MAQIDVVGSKIPEYKECRNSIIRLLYFKIVSLVL